jgi:hypothetical protein
MFFMTDEKWTIQNPPQEILNFSRKRFFHRYDLHITLPVWSKQFWRVPCLRGEKKLVEGEENCPYPPSLGQWVGGIVFFFFRFPRKN